jgi:PiT family inorganic phosphate transporter
MILLFLSSGLFLGWSLGANDAANVFGTAVATRMVKFRTAAAVCGAFVIVGSVISGEGAVGTLGELGAVTALGGSFMVALAAALAVLWMTRAGLPVSVSQAIIGGILGWNLFTGSRTDVSSLVTIVSTWIVCPILAAVFAAAFYLMVRFILDRTRLHILQLDALTRTLLIIVGAFGAYALGANNIANVMGVFVPAFPAGAFPLFGTLQISHTQILLLLGGAAIAAGVMSYSHRVMMTIGKGLFKLTPVTALVVVLAQSIVLFLFASERLESCLITHGLPAIPLVPVSSSQAVIGAVIGIALVKGGRNIRFGMLRRVAGGWVATPVIAAVIAFLGLFFLQNVFGLAVRRPAPFSLSGAAIERLTEAGLERDWYGELRDVRFGNARDFEKAVESRDDLGGDVLELVFEAAEIESFAIDPGQIDRLDRAALTPGRVSALEALACRTFSHRWQLRDALIEGSDQWASLPEGREGHLHNKRLAVELSIVYDAFRVPLRLRAR